MAEALGLRPDAPRLVQEATPAAAPTGEITLEGLAGVVGALLAAAAIVIDESLTSGRSMMPRTHAAWLGSSVFDGARAFEGAAPDLGLHCARVNRSAASLWLKPFVTVDKWLDLVKTGLKRFDPEAALYIRPMVWAERGGMAPVSPDPESTRWCLTLHEAPMPKPTGFRIALSPFRRSTINAMPVDAKAGCLYPNSARAALEAKSRGFDNCLLPDMLGNIAELANSNIMMAMDG